MKQKSLKLERYANKKKAIGKFILPNGKKTDCEFSAKSCGG